MSSKKILKNIKKGQTLLITEEVNSLGEKEYEEHLFYIPNKNIFCRQEIDWQCYLKYGMKKGIIFENLDESEALILIMLKLEQDAE